MRVNEIKPITDQSLVESIKNSNQGVFELVFNFYYSDWLCLPTR
jgi:hypothetical protein